MKYLVVGEFQQALKKEIGWVANSADQLARAGFPVPYSLIITRAVFEEFLVESGAVTNLFSLIKKGKVDKAAHLITSTAFPRVLEEELMDLLESHNIKEFDMHTSHEDESVEYHCYRLRRTHLTHALKACWAEGVKGGNDPFSAVVLTKNIGAKKTGKVMTQHPMTNSRARCVIELKRPTKASFVVETQSGKVKEEKRFYHVDSPLLLDEKDKILNLVHIAQGFSSRPLVIDWALGDHVYALSYRELTKKDRDHFFNQATSSGSN